MRKLNLDWLGISTLAYLGLTLFRRQQCISVSSCGAVPTDVCLQCQHGLFLCFVIFSAKHFFINSNGNLKLVNYIEKETTCRYLTLEQ
jgi:hypothetical protein